MPWTPRGGRPARPGEHLEPPGEGGRVYGRAIGPGEHEPASVLPRLPDEEPLLRLTGAVLAEHGNGARRY